ncbi:MAG: hypothetical protein M3297_03550 [Thermoproteota archaeon]|nr:hypothetical protein [Thermoproteota archaeon]
MKYEVFPASSSLLKMEGTRSPLTQSVNGKFATKNGVTVVNARAQLELQFFPLLANWFAKL